VNELASLRTRDGLTWNRIRNCLQLTAIANYNDRRKDALRIVPEFGCEPVGDTYGDDVTYLQLRLPRHLRVGEPHFLVYRVIVESNEPCQPKLLLAPNSDEDEFVLHVEFSSDELPREIWRFSELTPYQSRNPDHCKKFHHAYDGSRFVTCEWRKLRAGYTYGITWDWQ
jgi:hypothetical protein